MARQYAAASAAALSLMLADPTLAQTYRDAAGSVVPGVVPVGGDGSGTLFTSSNPGKVSGSFSATFSGFQPTPAYSYQSVTTSSAAYPLPAGAVVIFYNTGASPITIKLGASGVSVVAGQADVIQPNAWMAFTVGSGTHYAAVGNGGPSTVVASGGAGMPTGSGGGSSGGTVALGAGSATIGSIANTSFAVSGTLPAFAATPTFNLGTLNGAATSAKQDTIAADLGTINATLGAPMQQTGGSVGVTSLPALPAGTNSIGAVTLPAATPWSEVVPANTTGVEISAAARAVFGVTGSTNGAAPLYVKIYDTATAPTCGSGTPVLRFEIPIASTNANGGGSNVPPLAAGGIALTNGLGVCVTAGIADADTTAPAAGVALVNLGWK